MERKIQNQEEHIRFLYDELESKETEIDDLKKSLDKANEFCRLRSMHKSNYEDEIADLKKLVEEQKVKIMCLRKHRNEILDRHEKMVDDYEVEFKAKEIDVKNLQEASQLLKQKISDQEEELDTKLLEIAELRKVSEKMNVKSSSNSLSVEMETASLREENERLKNEIEQMKKKDDQARIMKKKRALYLSKLDNASTTMKDELESLKCSLKELAKVEKQARCPFKWSCNRLFCNLDHTFLYRKLNELKSAKSTSKPAAEFSCEMCGLKVGRQSQLDVHTRLKHEDVAHLACDKCTFKCNNNEEMETHMKQNHPISCVRGENAAKKKTGKKVQRKAKKNNNTNVTEAFIKISETLKDVIDDNIEGVLVEDNDECKEEDIECSEDNSYSSVESSKSSTNSESEESSLEEEFESGEV